MRQIDRLLWFCHLPNSTFYESNDNFGAFVSSRRGAGMIRQTFNSLAECLKLPEFLNCKRWFYPDDYFGRVKRNLSWLWDRSIFDRLLLTGWIGLVLAIIPDFFAPNDDLLFFERCLIVALVLRQIFKFFKLQIDPAASVWALVWIGCGLFISLLAVLVFPSATIRVYGILLAGVGLGWRMGGVRMLAELTHLAGALAVMTYPPKAVFEVLNAGARDLSLWLTQEIARIVLPEFHFHREWIEHKGLNLLIEFAASCSGFQFFLTYFAVSLVLKKQRRSVTDTIFCLSYAAICALWSNVVRVLVILFLVEKGYAEAALHSHHALIGHLCMGVGLTLLLLILESRETGLTS